MARRKIDKQALASLIRESKELSNDQKSDLLQLLNEQKRYGLVWEQHKEEAEELLKENIPVLIEETSKRIISSPRDKACANEKNQVHLDSREQPSLGEANCQEGVNHILIEGDNLHALTALTYTHEGKVDVIYIDPPYNTGNKDFVYNDSFVDSEDGYRHSKWLSFMEKRLRIAKKLLNDEGAILISIDENELYPLKILCDEVFGQNNFIGQWNWYKSATPPALSLKLKRNVEYIICYEKSRTGIKYRGVQKTSNSNDPITKPQNTYKELTFPAKSLNIKLTDQIVPKGIYGTAKFPNELLCDMIVKKGTNENEVTFRNRFIWLQSTLDEEIKKKTTFDVSKQLVISYKRSEYSPEVPPNFIDVTVGVDTNEEAGKALAHIIGTGKFDYPKPVSLIKYLLGFKKNSLILDFFAGSGTTLHATMQLNAEDGGHRQCILVTNNENNICEEVTYERNKRVINGYTTPKGVPVPGLTNNNLRYYKTEFVSREVTFDSKQDLMRKCADMICIKEDIYTEQREFCGMKFKPSLLRYFKEADGSQMLLIFDERVIEHIVPMIKTLEGQLKIYVFSNGQYAYEDEFLEVASKVEVCAMPEAILQVYNKTLPEREERPLSNSPEGEGPNTERISL